MDLGNIGIWHQPPAYDNWSFIDSGKPHARQVARLREFSRSACLHAAWLALVEPFGSLGSTVAPSVAARLHTSTPYIC
jgi:hypothetical protein